MNYSTAVMLINQNIRAISCTYEPDATDSRGNVTNTVKREIFKTLDKTIKKGDLVIVATDTRHKATVVKVDATDIDVDFDSNVQVGWIIDKVHPTAYETTLKQEQEWIEKLRHAENQHKRKELAAKLVGGSLADAGLADFAIAKAAEPDPLVIEHKHNKAPDAA